MPLASSVEKYIESDVMRDGLMDIQAKWYEFFFEIADTDRDVDTVLAQGREIVGIASDAYITWWADDQSRIVRRRLLMADARNRVTAYFTSHAAAARLAQTIGSILGKVPEVFSYPYDPEEHQAAYRRKQQLRQRHS